MEQVAITALEADVLKLALAAVGVLAVALVLIVYFGARAITGILAAQSKLLDAYQQVATAIHNLTLTLTSMTNDMRIFQQNQTVAVAALHGDFRQYLTTSETRHQTVVEMVEESAKKQVAHFESIKTDLEGVAGRLIESSVDRIDQAVEKAVQPALQNFGVIRTSIEEIERRREERETDFQRQKAEAEAQYRTDIQAVWDKVAETQQQFLQMVGDALITVRGASDENNTQQNLVPGPDLPDTGQLVHPGSGAVRSNSRADGAAAGGDSAAPAGAAASQPDDGEPNA